jgi:MFS family permease
VSAPAPAPAAARRRLPATVVALGAVSLLTDASSEMIVPLLPAFLATLGASAAWMGLIDGVAESTSALLKLYAGAWSDRARRRKPLVVVGYGLASLARPMVALAQLPWHVLGIRFVDRIGKGLRSSPRDALIAEAAGEGQRGAAFGFHRAMDHAGALLGPLVAYALLAAGLGTRSIFALAAVPAALAVLTLVLWVHEAPRPAPAAAVGAGLLSGPPLPAPLRRYLGVVAIFTLASSTDFFLLLRAHALGVPVAHAPLLWALLHLVKSSLSTPLGALSDRVPRQRLIVAGWLAYALIYGAFAFASAPWHVWLLFAVYGTYAAAVEGAEKALVADLAPAAAKGRAFGWFNFTVGVCALPASLGFGLVWDHLGPEAAFLAGAGLAAVAAIALVVWAPRSATLSA